MVVNGSVIVFFWPLAAACRPNKEQTQAKAKFFYTHEESKQKRIGVSGIMT
jgi:hypothetical protein